MYKKYIKISCLAGLFFCSVSYSADFENNKTGQIDDIRAHERCCKVCSKTDKLYKCSGCKSVDYCSRDCQTKDWPSHRGSCKSLTKPKVIYFPTSHKVDGVMGAEAKLAQKKLYDEIKALVLKNPTLKIVAESLYYDPNDDSLLWYKKHDMRFNRSLSSYPNNQAFLEQNGALATLLAEGVITEKNLIKSVSLAPDSPYKKADEQYSSLRTRLINRSMQVGENQAINEIMPPLRRAMGIDREVEAYMALAKSLKANKEILHVLIYGATHEFSRYFKQISVVDFKTAPGFHEQPVNDNLQPTDSEYRVFFEGFNNPLKDI